MDFTIPGDAADTPAGVVAFVHLKQFEHFSGPFRVFLEQTLVQVRTVCMVIHGEDFLGLVAVVKVFCAVHDQVKHLAGFRVA